MTRYIINDIYIIFLRNLRMEVLNNFVLVSVSWSILKNKLLN